MPDHLIMFRPIDHGRVGFIRLYTYLGVNPKAVFGPERVREVSLQIVKWIDGTSGFFCNESFN